MIPGYTLYTTEWIQLFNPRRDGTTVRAELGLGPGVPLIGVVGRIAHWKGHKLFLHAAARVRESLPETRFLIVGDAVTSGDHRLKEELFQLVQVLGLEEAVIFTGVRSDVPEVMAALNILVLPSELPEPLGRVVLEAMATARPVVATRQGGPLEIVVDGETGYLVPPRDPQLMAEAILSLLQAPERARMMGRAGRTRCEQRFTVERTCRDIVHVYEAILQKRHR
jgi:glycosyltransferase involved in cell wall biosynthesis